MRKTGQELSQDYGQQFMKVYMSLIHAIKKPSTFRRMRYELDDRGLVFRFLSKKYSC